jgi:hypothetical protein
MKYNRLISLTFNQNNPNASVNISVPMQVKRIHIKALAFMSATVPADGAAEYGFITSDLTQNTPIGMFYDDQRYPMPMGEDVEFVFQNPQPVNGVYIFSLKEIDGTPYLPFDAGGAKVGMILEFNDENELSH